LYSSLRLTITEVASMVQEQWRQGKSQLASLSIAIHEVFKKKKKKQTFFLRTCPSRDRCHEKSKSRLLATDKMSKRKRENIVLFSKGKRGQKERKKYKSLYIFFLADVRLVTIILSSRLLCHHQSKRFWTHFQYRWTSLHFFLPSLLHSQIHEFPIFVIAYLQGRAMAAGVE